MATSEDMTWEDVVSLIENTPGALEQLLIHFERAGKIPKELSHLAAHDAIESDTSTDAPDVIPPSEATSELKNRLNVFVDALKDAKKNLPVKKRDRRPKKQKETETKKVTDPNLWWFVIIERDDQYNGLTLGGNKKRRMGSLASHLGLRDKEFRDLREAAGVMQFSAWKKKLGVNVQSTEDGKVTWIVLDEVVDAVGGWSHTPRDQVTGAVTRPAWVGRPKVGYVEGVSAAEKRAGQMTRATLGLIDKLVKNMTDAQILQELEETAKRSRKGVKNTLVEYKIADRTFSLPCNYQPVMKRNYEELEKEVAELRTTNQSLETELSQLKAEATENERYSRIGRALANIKNMRQRPPSSESDTVYAHMQAVAPRASPFAFEKLVPLALTAFLLNIGIGGRKDPENNDIIESIPNATPTGNTFRDIIRRGAQMVYQRIAMIAQAGNPIAVAFDKGERAGLGRMVKEKSSFDHAKDRVVSIRLNSDGAKGQDKEAAEALNSTFNEVDAYRTDGETTTFVGQCTDSGGGGTTEGVAAQMALVKRRCLLVYYIAACTLHALSKALQNAAERSFGASGLNTCTFMQLLHTCWSAQEALGENFDAIWNHVNPTVRVTRVLELSEADIALLNSLPPDDTNAKVQKPLITRWWHVNVCALQIYLTYDAWIKFFEYLYETSKGEKIKTISENGLKLIKSNKLRCDLVFFCAFSRAYWSKHMKWLHRIDEIAKTFGHSSRLILVRYMIMLNDLQGVKTMQSSIFDDYKRIRNALPSDDQRNDVYGKETAEKQATAFFETYESTLRDNMGRWCEANLLPLAIGGSGLTQQVFAQWLCDKETVNLGEENMVYYDPSHECNINLIKFREFLDISPRQRAQNHRRGTTIFSQSTTT